MNLVVKKTNQKYNKEKDYQVISEQILDLMYIC